MPHPPGASAWERSLERPAPGVHVLLPPIASTIGKIPGVTGTGRAHGVKAWARLRATYASTAHTTPPCIEASYGRVARGIWA